MKTTILTLDRVFHWLGLALFYLTMACIVLLLSPGIIYFGIPTVITIWAQKCWGKKVAWASH